ncbi:MAG: hypothetical protein WC643_03225 [Parcubacteria group bacterium]|jgi:hypothetical protein
MNANSKKLVFKSDAERRKYIEKVFKGTRVMEILEDIDRIMTPIKKWNEEYKKEKMMLNTHDWKFNEN